MGLMAIARLAKVPFLLLSRTWTDQARKQVTTLLHSGSDFVQHNLSLRRPKVVFTVVELEASMTPKGVFDMILVTLDNDLLSYPRGAPVILFGETKAGLVELEWKLVERMRDEGVVGRVAILWAGSSEEETKRMDQISRDWEDGKIDYLLSTTAGIQALDCPVSSSLFHLMTRRDLSEI